MKNYHCTEILNLISENILKFDLEYLLGLYKCFEKKDYREISIEKIHAPFYNYLSSTIVFNNRQFDLPYFLPYNGKEKCKGTLMLLGMDAKGQHGNDYTLLSSPYDIHGKSPKAEYVDYINVLRTSYNIYLTDIFKAYWSEKDGKASNQNPNYIAESFHKKLLEKEIQILKKSKKMVGILTWGEQARNAILDSYNIPINKNPSNPKGQISKENLIPYKLTEKIKLIASTHPGKGNGHRNSYFRFNKLGEKWDSEIMANAVVKSLE